MRLIEDLFFSRVEELTGEGRAMGICVRDEKILVRKTKEGETLEVVQASV